MESKNPKLISIRTRLIQSIVLHSMSLKSTLILCSHQRIHLPIGYIPSYTLRRNPYTNVISLLRATCPVFIRIKFYEKYIMETAFMQCYPTRDIQ
jgi:hypothetical protein